MITLRIIMYSAPTGFEAATLQANTAGTGTEEREAMYFSVAV